MKPRLYLETTIPSYLTAWPSRDLIIAGHQQITKEWWRRRREAFDLFVSQLVVEEAGEGDSDAARDRLLSLEGLPQLEITAAVNELARALLREKVLPRKAAADAGHIAVSAVHELDYLMTWNCAHIANATIFKDVEGICLEHGVRCPVICTPEALMGELQ